MGGGFHGKHELAFDGGEFFEFSHHQVIPCAVIADGKGSLDDLALGSDNCDFVVTDIPSHTYESYPASISAENTFPHPAQKWNLIR